MWFSSFSSCFMKISTHDRVLIAGLFTLQYKIKSPLQYNIARDVKYAVPPLLSEYNSNHFILLNAERRTVLKSLRGGFPCAFSELLTANAVLSVRRKQKYCPHQRFKYRTNIILFFLKVKYYFITPITLYYSSLVLIFAFNFNSNSSNLLCNVQTPILAAQKIIGTWLYNCLLLASKSITYNMIPNTDMIGTTTAGSSL